MECMFGAGSECMKNYYKDYQHTKSQLQRLGQELGLCAKFGKSLQRKKQKEKDDEDWKKQGSGSSAAYLLKNTGK